MKLLILKKIKYLLNSLKFSERVPLTYITQHGETNMLPAKFAKSRTIWNGEEVSDCVKYEEYLLLDHGIVEMREGNEYLVLNEMRRNGYAMMYIIKEDS